MAFYFIVHTLLGLIWGSSNILIIQGKNSVGSVPPWVHRVGPLFALLAMVACAAAVLTTLMKFDLIWAGITIAEVFFGLFLAWFIPYVARALLTLTSVITIPGILGALWGFWYF